MSEMRIVVCPILTPVFVLSFERIAEPDLQIFFPCRRLLRPPDIVNPGEDDISRRPRVFLVVNKPRLEEFGRS
jgi:hypothetical protein